MFFTVYVSGVNIYLSRHQQPLECAILNLPACFCSDFCCGQIRFGLDPLMDDSLHPSPVTHQCYQARWQDLLVSDLQTCCREPLFYEPVEIRL